MEQPIEDGRGQDLVVEGLCPVGKARVTGDDQARPLVPADQEAEEKAGFLAGQGEVVEFVHLVSA